MSSPLSGSNTHSGGPIHNVSSISQNKPDFSANLLNLFDQIEFEDSLSKKYIEPRDDDGRLVSKENLKTSFAKMLNGINTGNLSGIGVSNVNLLKLKTDLEKICEKLAKNSNDYDLWGPYVRNLAVASLHSPVRYQREVEQILELLSFS